jgi:hypothetical protein
MTKRKAGAPVVESIALLGELARVVERHKDTYKELLRLEKANEAIRSANGSIDVAKLSEVERLAFERRSIQALNKSDVLQDRAADAEAAHLRAFESVNTTAAKNAIPVAVREALAKACDELLRFSQALDVANQRWLSAGMSARLSELNGGAE